MGFFAFMDLWSQTRFSVCRYRCGNGLGFQRDGRFLRFWVSNRGESALLAHDLCQHKSSVLYLLRPLTLERGCFHAEHTISSGCRTGGFWRAMRLKIRICPSDKIRLFGCRWCCAVERILKKSSERSGITGGAEGISNPPQRRIFYHFGNATSFSFGSSVFTASKMTSIAFCA